MFDVVINALSQMRRYMTFNMDEILYFSSK